MRVPQGLRHDGHRRGALGPRPHHRHGPHRDLEPQPPVPLPQLGRRQCQVRNRRSRSQEDEPRAQRPRDGAPRRQRHRGRFQRRVLGRSRRRLQRARQCQSPPLRRLALCPVLQAAPRVRHPRAQGLRPGRHPASHRVLRLVARPAGEGHPAVHAPQLPVHDRPLHPARARRL
eukprot:Amastigsp_a843731_23.p4 type:complete len:173 gc:universal Amastigsp_a843731_23:1818-1300(-)